MATKPESAAGEPPHRSRSTVAKRAVPSESADSRAPQSGSGPATQKAVRTISGPTASPTDAEVASRHAPTLKKTASQQERARRGQKPVEASGLPIRPGEDPWTEEELEEVRAELTDDIARLSREIETSEAELVGRLRDGSDGAGRDPADVGSANFERDHGMSLANNAREMLEQSRLALRHIELGSYGICDNCEQPIGKGRLQVYPRATLCVACKQREERR